MPPTCSGLGVKNEQEMGLKMYDFSPPFSAKNTDAEDDFLDIALKMMQNHFMIKGIIK